MRRPLALNARPRAGGLPLLLLLVLLLLLLLLSLLEIRTPRTAPFLGSWKSGLQEQPRSWTPGNQESKNSPVPGLLDKNSPVPGLLEIRTSKTAPFLDSFLSFCFQKRSYKNCVYVQTTTTTTTDCAPNLVLFCVHRLIFCCLGCILVTF